MAEDDEWIGRSTTHYEKSFTVKPSDTSAEIAEAFGIEGGYEKQILDLDIPTPLPDITYITGESGCGKSTLLREMASNDDVKWEDLNAEAVPDGPLWTWAGDTDTAIELLSKVGLGDATLFVSRYNELSDSQQYRARLYLGLLADTEMLFFDEFLSTLDRRTAHAVAHVFQKAIRRSDKRAVVVTAHADLGDYLQPGLTIRGRAFPSRWEIHRDTSPVENPFVDQLSFEWEDPDWYQQCALADLHYKGKHTGGIKDYLAGYLDDRLISFLIGTYRIHDGGRRISRVVTHPSYRSLGLGQATIEYYLDEHPGADTVAEMAKYNPVFEKAGMERVEDSVVEPPSGLKSDLDDHGFDFDQWYKRSYCIDFMQAEVARVMFAGYASQVAIHIAPGGADLSDEAVARKLRREPQTAGRVLWNVRPKRMAKFVGPEYGEHAGEDDGPETGSAAEVPW